jgi:uncharacterized membrane protein YeiH
MTYCPPSVCLRWSYTIPQALILQGFGTIGVTHTVTQGYPHEFSAMFDGVRGGAGGGPRIYTHSDF